MATSMTLQSDAERDHLGSIALDQWRGLALLMVLVAHAFHETKRVDGLGRVGVNLFFFISGILVFRSLVRSANPSPWQRTWSFWRRRWRRLYPALAAYVLAMGVGEYWLQKIPGQTGFFTQHSFLAHAPLALLYLQNYSAICLGFTAPPSLGHLWSLSCEMQFYMFAPLIFFMGGHTYVRRQWVFGLILLILLGLGLAQPFLHDLGPGSKYYFPFAVWPMMFGFYCEYNRAWLGRFSPRCRWLSFQILLAVSLAGLMLMFFGGQMKLVTIAVGGLLLAPCLLAYDSGWTLSGNAGGAALRWLGQRTYSLYLWQQAFTICGFLPVYLWPVGAVLTIPVGAFWFYFFEAPFLSASRKSDSATSLMTLQATSNEGGPVVR